MASSASISSRVVMPPAAVTPVRRRVADRLHRIHVDPAHQALGVDVGVEELAAAGLEAPHGLDGADRQSASPAVDDDLRRRASTAAITRSAPHALGHRRRERLVDAVRRKSADPTMTSLRAGVEGAVRPPRPCGGRRRRGTAAPGRSARRGRQLSPRAHRGVEVDELDPRELREPLHPARTRRRRRAPRARPARAGRPGRLGGRSRESAWCSSQPDRDAARSRSAALSVRTLLVRVVEDRRGQRGVGAARGEHVGEVLAAPGAARGDDRDGHGVGDGGRQLAVETRSSCRRVDRGQQDLAGAALLGLARPLDGVPRRCGRAAAWLQTANRARRRAWRRWRRRPPGCRSGPRARVMSAGSASAAVLRLTLSAPASTRRRGVVLACGCRRRRRAG